LIKVAVN